MFRASIVGCCIVLLLAATGGNALARSYPDADKIVVIGNLGGDTDQMEQLLRATGVTNPEGDWAGGSLALVGTGDMVGSPLSAEMRRRMQALSDQAQAANGAAVWLLGEQEIQAMGASEAEGREWLMQRPVVATVGDLALVHGGLSKSLANGSLEQANQAFRQRAATGDLSIGADPVGYQGTRGCHPFGESGRVASALQNLGASMAVIGHPSDRQPEAVSRFQGRVLQMGGQPSALLLQDGVIRQLALDGSELEITSPPPRNWSYPNGMSDADVEHFLATAPVVKTEDVGSGITNPKRLTLSDGTTTMRAVFKYYDSDPGLEKSFSYRREHNSSDRFQYEVAAYRIDRLMNLQLIPAAVIRRVGTDEGAVQYWVEDTFNENDRRDEEIKYTGICNLRSQYDVMDAFDVLIYNNDRNQSNILYTSDWQVFLIDHTRAFSSRGGRPKMLARTRFKLQPMMARALTELSDQALQREMQGLLHKRQILGLQKRRDELLKLLP
ncbi:MAG: hypothetical protein QNJ40_25000 [Xanthomonadales bacterium]|nr:hypothetical protein [Xanthomonadales bacterium]